MSSQSFVIYNTLNPPPETVEESSMRISNSSDTSTSSRFIITRNEAVQVNNKKFTTNPEGLVKLRGNWDLSKSDKGAYLWVFSKTLTHDPVTFLPDTSQVDKLLDYFIEPTFEKLTNLPSALRSTRKLEDPTGGLGFEPIGEHQSLITSDTPYIPINSPQGVMEMTEVYCMALGRDILISDLNSATDPSRVVLTNGKNTEVTAKQILDHLNKYNSRTAVKPNWPLNEAGLCDLGTMFRGSHPDELKGQYISQFLIQDIPYSNGKLEQKYVRELDSNPNNFTNPSTTIQGYLAIQNGEVGTLKSEIPIPGARRMQTLRDLASFVHNDPAYGAYFNAALIARPGLVGLKSLKDQGNGSNFLDTGGPDLLTTLAAVTRAALRTAWITKWQNALKIRPEMVAGRIVWLHTDASAATRNPSMAAWRDLFEPELLTSMNKWNAGQGGEHAFLPLVFPEGSPTHPAYPAGHALVAGACVTILKAFLDTHDNEGNKRKWVDIYSRTSLADGALAKVDDGSGDLALAIPVGETLVGELNKLASNMSLGRNLAGVHYRCDGACGCEMGEQVAISYLQSMTKAYYPEILQPHIEFVLEKFNGEIVSISNGIVSKK